MTVLFNIVILLTMTLPSLIIALDHLLITPPLEYFESRTD